MVTHTNCELLPHSFHNHLLVFTNIGIFVSVALSLASRPVAVSDYHDLVVPGLSSA